MGKRGRRKLRELQAGGLPSGYLMGIATGMRLFEGLREGTTIEDAIARRRNDLRALLSRADAVHVLAQVALGETFMDPNTYRESEHGGQAYVVEMVAAELLSRPSRAGEGKYTPPIDGNFLDEIRLLVREAVQLESLRRFRSAGGFESPQAAARGRAASQHLMMRAPGWPWQEHTVLRGLFGPEHIGSKLRASLGFDAEDAISCVEAMSDLVPDLIQGHMSAARAKASDFGPGSEAFAWAEAEVSGSWRDAPDDGVKPLAMTAVWALNHVGDALQVSRDLLSERAGVTSSAAQAFLRSLSIGFGELGGDWFSDAEAVRYRPYVRLADDAYLPTVGGNDLWSLRRLFERALGQDDAYLKYRGRWLEKTALETLAAPLRPDEVYDSVDYAYKDDEGNEVSGEIDGLIRLGDVALLVEAKGATIRMGAKRGGAGLIDHLRKNVTRAAEQAEQAREALRRGDCLTMAGKPMTLATPIREVHPIVVTLDDFSSVAPVIWQFTDTKVMPEGIAAPWIVTLYELDLVCETIGLPATFVHFLRRRSRLNAIGGLTATDELDWWMHYLEQGLYFEDEEDSIRFTSLTDPLDAWVLYAHGRRTVPAPKPELKLDASTTAVLEMLQEARPPGWVAASCSLLEPAGVVRRRIWKDVQKLRRKARERNKVQRATLLFDEGPEPLMICIIVAPNSQQEYLGRQLHDCIEERFEEYGARRTLGMAHLVSSDRVCDAVAVVERHWQD